MKLLTILLSILLTGCVAFKENGKWTSVPLFGGEVVTRTVINDEATINHGVRTDLITVQLTVEVMPSIVEKCAEWSPAIACATNNRVYIQGTPQTATMLMDVQFTEWGDKPRYEDGTLYTYAYPTIGHNYEMGLVGDLLADALDLDIGFNRRKNLGHEFMAHVAGLGHPFIFEWSVNEGLN